MALDIRPMRIEDFAQVYRLGLRCYDVLDKPYNYWTLREVADHLQGDPGLCFVAVEGERVVGFCLGARDYELMEETGHLEWIAVAPEYRLRGLARRLVETVVDAMRALGRRRVVADVSSANAASRRLFGRTGFHEGISVTFFARDLDRTRA